MTLPVIPKKSLGQNFLNSQRVIVRFGELITQLPTDSVLEIGPGLGFLTRQLLQSHRCVVAVEKDMHLYELLQETFSKEIQQKHLILLSGDILDFNPIIMQRFGKNYQIAANIPYNITGLIFRKFLSDDFPPKHMTVLIQKEVATRILAKNNKESLLSLSIKAYGEPKLVTHVSRGNFTPPPNVDSSIISIQNISKSKFVSKNHEELFFKLIHAGFGHKRKTLLKNLIDASIGDRSYWEKTLVSHKLTPSVRAEDLTLEQWMLLSGELVHAS